MNLCNEKSAQWFPGQWSGRDTEAPVDADHVQIHDLGGGYM